MEFYSFDEVGSRRDDVAPTKALMPHIATRAMRPPFVPALCGTWASSADPGPRRVGRVEKPRLPRLAGDVGA